MKNKPASKTTKKTKQAAADGLLTEVPSESTDMLLTEVPTDEIADGLLTEVPTSDAQPGITLTPQQIKKLRGEYSRRTLQSRFGISF
jgi:hypothetical protein